MQFNNIKKGEKIMANQKSAKIKRTELKEPQKEKKGLITILRCDGVFVPVPVGFFTRIGKNTPMSDEEAKKITRFTQLVFVGSKDKKMAPEMKKALVFLSKNQNYAFYCRGVHANVETDVCYSFI